VAWIKEAESHPAKLGAFPIHAQILQSDLQAIARNLKTLYPNIKIAYFSSRTRAYTNDPTTLNPEPFAYESAFAVRWMLEDQLDGAANLNFDSSQGPVVAPWMAWGPYLWADGTNPRSDGFVWLCSDLQGDFTHPSPSGDDKVTNELLAFFKTHPTATPWFLRSTIIGQPPIASATAMPTNGLAPLAVNFSGTASDPSGTITQYAWTYDDGDFSFAQNPTKTFSAPGSYNARLTVEDNSGNSVLKVVPITVTNGSKPTPTPTPTTGPAVMLSPTPGSNFTSSSVTFSWSAGSASAYIILVGSSLHGSDIYNSGIVHTLSATVNNMPVDGRTIYVTLTSQVNGSWITNSYTYTAK
jgi:PKD repeat protein